MPFPPLIGAAALQDRLDDPALVVLDASWYLPSANIDARTAYASAHLPGARFFDLDAISDPATELPHMLPAPAEFESAAGALGIGRDSDVVVYDASGVNLSAARVWWMFRAFGHARVAVLDGGLGAWREEGRPMESGTVPAPPHGDFAARLDSSQLRSLADMRRLLGTGEAQVVDMRPAGRFLGRDAEPRPGVRSGHMPGSLNLPYAELVDETGRMLAPPLLRERLIAAGIDSGRPLVALCGSGTSACALLLALEVLGDPAGALYDGSWTEWGSRADMPIARE